MELHISSAAGDHSTQGGGNERRLMFDTQASKPKIGRAHSGQISRQSAAPGFVALFLSEADRRSAGQGVPRRLTGTRVAQECARPDR